MQKKKQLIYLIFSCDEWSRHDSMELMLATTDAGVAKRFVGEQIRKQVFFYADRYFKDDAAELDGVDLMRLNQKLSLGHVRVIRDGERCD